MAPHPLMRPGLARIRLGADRDGPLVPDPAAIRERLRRQGVEEPQLRAYII